MLLDRKLSDHFSLFDLTATTRQNLQEMNRQLTAEQVDTLSKVAALLETVWALIGEIWVTSGYRCPALNVAVGSSQRSQHLKCEAADVVPVVMDKLEAFKALRKAAHDGKIRFGQLIFERADREGQKTWLHISLAEPYRDPARSGQILVMNEGNYELIETIPAPEVQTA